MREFIDLVESLLSERVAMHYSPFSEPHRKFPIFKNDGRTQMLAVLKTAQHGEGLRALLDEPTGDVFFWDAYAAAHVAIRRALGLTTVIHLTLFEDRVEIVQARGGVGNAVEEKWIPEVQANRHIQRLYGPKPNVTIARN